MPIDQEVFGAFPYGWSVKNLKNKGESPSVAARGVEQIGKGFARLVRSLDFTLKITWSHKRFLKRVVNR